jgi:SagB-type dehydrogenase family enzyme
MSAGKTFMEQTKYPLPDSPQYLGEPQPPLQLDYDTTKLLIDLPAPTDCVIGPVDVYGLITERVTVRQYSPQALSLAELSFLMWSTQGVKPNSPPNITRRTVPSAGSRHAFETYLLINRVDGLEPGLYRYLALSHQLIREDADAAITDQMTQACHNQHHVRGSAVTFVWVAVTERMTYRYVDRGYRYLLLDAGHVCQNLYLAAWAVNCGVCALAAFDDNELDALLKLDGEHLFAIYAATLGKRV